MTLALLELAVGGAFLYAGFKCLKLIPLLVGNEVPGDACTGSLLAIVGAYITAKVGSGLIQKILAAAGGAAAGAAAKAGAKALGRGGGGSTPTEPVPPPEVPAVPEIPAAIPLAYNTPPASAALGVNVATAIPLQQKGLGSFTVTV